MPQTDRHRTRVVPIEFEANEDLNKLPYKDRLTIVLLTSGKLNIMRNMTAFVVAAPAILLVSENDDIKLVDKYKVSAKSFSFNPAFLNSSLTFESLRNNSFSHIEDEHDRNMLMMFLHRDSCYHGIQDLPANIYLRLSEWLSIIGTETNAQSDAYWTCRIRRYLLQSLYLIDDIFISDKYAVDRKSSKFSVDIALEFIHLNYQSDISLDDLCKLTGSNRTTLNRKFKSQVGRTITDYIINYRIKIACDALSHTNLNLNEIAEACGFKYDTYFIKQFKKKMNLTPTQYRQKSWDMK